MSQGLPFLTDHPLLRDLELIVGASALFALVATRLRVPKIVGYILAGLLLGPATRLLSVSESVDLVAETGIALLLFLVGLELSFEKVRDVGRVAVLAGTAQVVATGAAGYGLARLLGLAATEAAVLAAALTFSSTVVVVKVLDQKRALDELYGRIAVGVLLVQDVVVVVALTFLAGLQRPGDLEAGAVAAGLLPAFAGMGLLLAVALVSARWILPLAFGWISRSLEATFIWSLCWCFLFILGAEALHLSLELGAFLAGISLAQLPYEHLLRRRVKPLMSFFIAVFFVTLGARMDLSAALAWWPEAALLSVFVLLGKPALFLWLLPRLGTDGRTAFLAGTSLAQISEFSFILAAMALGAGLIGPGLLSAIGLVGLVTIATSTFLLVHGERLYALARRVGLPGVGRTPGEGPADVSDEPPGAEGPSGHVVVVGMNELGTRLVRALAERGETVVAVDTDSRKLLGLPARTLLGDVDRSEVVSEAGVERARLVVSALQIEETNNLLAYRCRRLSVPCSIHAFDQSVVPELRALEAEHLILSKNAGIRELTSELRAAGVIGA